MQAFGAVHDTARSGPGTEVLSVDHAVPSHRSTTSPTAMQAVADVHDTAFSPVGAALLGFAIV